MLVRGMLEIPPLPGRVVVPRTAVVVGQGQSCVFVESKHGSGRFERRRVALAHEKEDLAVIEHGLRPGEEVVAVGGLILAQMYEDLETVAAHPATPEPAAVH